MVLKFKKNILFSKEIIGEEQMVNFSGFKNILLVVLQIFFFFS
jgi:hypothetical protein